MNTVNKTVIFILEKEFYDFLGVHLLELSKVTFLKFYFQSLIFEEIS